jgi:hypothetical protein
MMRTPDGHSKLELTKYHTPAAVGVERENPPPNTLGLHRVMFALDDIDDAVARLRAPRRRTSRRGGAVREHLPALLPPRPLGIIVAWPNRSADTSPQRDSGPEPIYWVFGSLPCRGSPWSPLLGSAGPRRRSVPGYARSSC